MSWAMMPNPPASSNFPPMSATTNIGPIQGRDIQYCPETGLVEFTSKGDCDCDGPGGSTAIDPDWQPTTSLRWFNPESGEMEYINSSIVPGIVVPPTICKKTRLKVLGCLGEVSFDHGPWVPGVVYDTGPSLKLGEYSWGMHKLLGTKGNPRSAIEGFTRLRCRIHTGVPAKIKCCDGVVREYALRSF